MQADTLKARLLVYHYYCPVSIPETEDIDYEKMITDSIPVVNNYLSENYGRWRPDAYNWINWLVSTYGHFILSHLFGLLHTEITDIVRQFDSQQNVLTYDNPLLKKIYQEGVLGNHFGHRSYIDSIKIAIDLTDQNVNSKHWSDYCKFCMSDTSRAIAVYARIQEIRANTPSEIRTNLPELKLFDYWRTSISKAFGTEKLIQLTY